MSTLRLGSAAADITPDWSLPLAGFAARTEPSRGVSQPLRVRMTVLESTEPGGETRRAVVAVADLLWWGPQIVPRIRSAIARAVGAPESRIILSATHTHSGPQTSTRASAEIGIADPGFLAMLHDRTVAAAREAAAGLEPVTLSRLESRHRLGFNRRVDRNPHGPEDDTLTVIRFAGLDGQPVALWVHYSCHPVITEQPLVSSEFCGAAMDRLEERLGVTAMYLQGCCGDINPDVRGERRTVRGTEADVERLGLGLAGAVERLLSEGTAVPLDPVPLEDEHRTVSLPFASVPSEAELRERSITTGVHGEAARALLEHPEWLAPSIPLHLQRLDVARGCSLLTMDGEIVVDYGIRIRAASDCAVLPLGYANGMVGYIPTARIIAEGGYEAGDAAPYFFLPGPFDPAVEAAVQGAVDSLLESGAWSVDQHAQP